MTTKRELETVSSILMLLAAVLLLLGPIRAFADAVQNGRLNLDFVALLFAVLAFASFAITWKGNSTVGGLLGLLVSLYFLFGTGTSGLGAAAAAFLLAGGIMAMLAGRERPQVFVKR